VNALEEVSPEAWDAILDAGGLGDVYLGRRYLESAALLGQGTPVYLRLAGAAGDVVFPCLLRDAGDGLSDVGTPMGYGGPAASGGDPPVDAFFEAYERWCGDRRVVATFARFHPVLANQRLAAGRWHVEHIGRSVGWRVAGQDADGLVAGMDSHHRRIVRKARAAGVEVEVRRSPDELAAFVGLYEETMRRRDASAFYFFPQAYWEHVLEHLGGVLVRADARLDGELLASILCFATPPLLHYHLGASSERGQGLGANHFLFLETAAWAAREGLERFHLGGGVGGFEDSLFDFKRRFDPDGTLPAFLGKAVHDEASYRRLSGQSSVDYAGYFPAYRRRLEV
jgi:hypothetical protein